MRATTVVSMQLDSIREFSIKSAKKMGISISTSLPLLDEPETSKSVIEAASRMLAMHAIAAVAYGFDRQKATQWLIDESILGDLTETEKLYMETGGGSVDSLKMQIEGLWALGWALSIVESIDFLKDCDNRFVMTMPNLKQMQNSSLLRSRLKLRPIEEIVQTCDWAYCLHWAIIEANLKGNTLPTAIKLYVIVERQHALEWLITSEDWDNTPLDTENAAERI